MKDLPKFDLSDHVRSVLDKSNGYLVTAIVSRKGGYSYMVKDSMGSEDERQEEELEPGNAVKEDAAIPND